EADAIVVVVSAVSVTKRWVAEELDAAVVKRIQQDALLIPVVLDDLHPSDVPPAIRHLLFEPVPDLDDLGAVTDRVVRSVLDEPDKPPLGPLPEYATTGAASAVEGLDAIDSEVLRL